MKILKSSSDAIQGGTTASNMGQKWKQESRREQ